MTADKMLIAKGDSDLCILPRMANRHGMISGATGTGKTVSLQVLAENFSRIGVPSFLADVKGDLAGISQPGTPSPRIQERIDRLKLEDFAFSGNPVTFWDVFGEQGHPIRTTVSDMGPLLFSRLLDLNEVQSGVLTLVFRVADDNGFLLLDFKDLRAMVQYVGDNPNQFETEYGRVSTASIGAVQRGLLMLEEQGGDRLFGEPTLNLDDLIQTDARGRGMINILAADKLMTSPLTYATFLLWLLAELFENLPEVGDLDKPRIVFFFDEAHLLFADAPQAMIQKVEQVVRLIRSKGVGIYFISQSPLDVPDVTLSQLGNRIQHALRAFTPRDQKAVRAAAETFRQNPAIDVEKAIMELGVGEALVSFLDEKGYPGVVERAFILPPGSQIGPIDNDTRKQIIRQSPVFGHYERSVDRDSAYEMLKERAEAAGRRLEEERTARERPLGAPGYPSMPEPFDPSPDRYPQPPKRPAGRPRDSLFEAMAKSAARSVGSQLGRQVLRGVLGSILGGRKR
ncbi:MAG: helicase HerA-like domain-containing protein [Candidatus Aminicenantales bacterium]